MGRKSGKYFRLLFRFFILLYCYHNLEVEAVPPSHENLETCDELHHFNRTHFEKGTEKNLQRTKRPARMIPLQYLFKKEKNDNTAEDQKIVDKRFYGPATTCEGISKLGYTLNGYYMVKRKNQTINDQVEVLGCRFKHPNGSKAAKEEKLGFIDIEPTKSPVKRRSQEPFGIHSSEAIENFSDRPKRPARLLPLRMFLEKSKNITGNESETRFLGPATSCEELKMLGFTLNGLYLVNCKDGSKNGTIEVVECRFKKPLGTKEAQEERLGFVKIEAKKPKTVERRHLSPLKETRSEVVIGRNSRLLKRPGRLLPFHLLYGKEENDNEVVERFYGPPNSCSELKKLGHTLNGYYLVNGTSIGHQIEISLCNFHQSHGFKDQKFVLVPKAARKVFQLLYPDDKTNEKFFPLKNVDTGKCFDAYNVSGLTEKDCNSPSIKYWKPVNNAKELCDRSLTNCISVEPLGMTDNIKDQHFVLVPPAVKVFKSLPLDHDKNESYPLMNEQSRKCLDADKNSILIETDCDSPTIKRWKMLNEGKQICDMSSAKCVTVKVDIGTHSPKFDYLLFLSPMLRDDSGEKNCKNCWVPNHSTQHVVISNLKNEVKIKYEDYDLCPYSALRIIKVHKCTMVRAQTWFFISFE